MIKPGKSGNSVLAASVSVIWEPQLGPQTALIQCPVFEVFFGGARGGGKTDSSIGDWLEHSGTYGEGAIGIFFRRKFTQLAEVIARTKQLFPKIGGKYNEQKREWLMPGGGRLKFAYLENDSDAEEYQGHNYTRVYVEEVTNFPSPDPINKLRATLRSGTGVPVGMRLTGNPGGPGHNWVKDRYITPNPLGYHLMTETAEVEVDGKMVTVSLDRVFIPSKLGDNMLLLRSDPSYVLRLMQSGSAALVKAWLEGNWDIIDGAYFSEYNPVLHVKPTALWLPRIPPTAIRFRAMDWGSAVPFSIGWYTISDGTWGLPRDALLKYREWYGASGDGPNKGLKMDSPLVARGIKRREEKESVRYGVAGHDIFIRNGGPSIMENMLIEGVSSRRADNKRIPGWEQMHHRLKGNTGEDGIVKEPMLYFLDCCAASMKFIPTAQHCDKNAEDVAQDGEDHVLEEIRYACMSRPWQPKVKVVTGTVYPKTPGQTTIDELIKQQALKNKQRNERL